MQRPPAKVGGYTIIELILVIVILGIIGVVAGPRFFATGDVENRAYYDELAAALRYGQKVATASGCAVQAQIGTTSYQLTQQAAASGHCNAAGGSFPTPVLLPDGAPLAGTAPDGVSVGPATSFVFLASGETTLGSVLTLSIDSRTLTVDPSSGLVITP